MDWVIQNAKTVVLEFPSNDVSQWFIAKLTAFIVPESYSRKKVTLKLNNKIHIKAYANIHDHEQNILYLPFMPE